MKSITIRLPDVEAAMLKQLQAKDISLRDLQGFLLRQIRARHQALFKT